MKLLPRTPSLILTGWLVGWMPATVIGASGESSFERKSISDIELIGEVSFPTGYEYEGTEVGGLSGVAYDSENGVYYALSDDRSQINDARFYSLTIDLTDGTLDEGDVVFTGVTKLLNSGGSPFAAGSVDPEGIAFSSEGTLFVASEGDANNLVNPFINEYALTGELLAELEVPSDFFPTEDNSSGIRNNLAFESLTLSPDGCSLTAATENALYQDGPAASLTEESPARMIRYDLVEGGSQQFTYPVGLIPDAPVPAGSFATNGLVELLALDDAGSYLALERAFSLGVGNTVKLFELNIERGNGPVVKRELLDIEQDLGIVPDNLEALVFGPTLPDGRQSLLIVSDNNFNAANQKTQFLAFAIEVETIFTSGVKDGYYFTDVAEGQINRFFSPDVIPNSVSAHRGGFKEGYPENALETFEETLRFAPATLEVDLRRTADGVWILMHDSRINRTTTGEGRVNNLTWDELDPLSLFDNDGRLTPYQVPTLEEALRWAEGRAILELDLKDEEEVAEVVQIITDLGAEDCVRFIADSVEQANIVHAANPGIHLGLFFQPASLESVFSAIENDAIFPLESVSSFSCCTGSTNPASFNDGLREAGLVSIWGAFFGVENRIADQSELFDIFVEEFSKGVQILGSDYYEIAAAAAGYEELPKTYPASNQRWVRSPNNPFLNEVDGRNLSGSRGFEGMAYSPDRSLLYPMLEGTVAGDPERSLRVYEFNVAEGRYTRLLGYYPADASNHAIGDFTPINAHEFLVIERDGGQGDAAAFKRVYKVDIANTSELGFFEKELVVDLLDIADPEDLNQDGEMVFTFPFVTIEDVLVLDENTIIVANDNNFPFSVGRGPDIDNNEIILIDLPGTMDVDPALGGRPSGGDTAVTVPTLAGFASLAADTFAAGPDSGGDNGNGQPISANGRTGPFTGQPVQGFSGVQFGDDGSYWFLTDNGFGGQSNSADYQLRIYNVTPDFESGAVSVNRFIDFKDPDNFIPFEIVHEGSTERMLTGADFDVESIVITNDRIWIGEEFGPYLLEFDLEGNLLSPPVGTPNLAPLEALKNTPIVVAHRGASGIRPEHTLEAYRVAMMLGADFIEPDLVTTSDGVLITRHEPILDGTTNVAEVFGPERMATKNLDGSEVTAYFAEDFTLAEIKQLRAIQPLPFRDQSFNGLFEIPTLSEVLQLVHQHEATTGRQVGVYIETKHPTFFDEQGLSLEEPLIETLKANNFTDPSRVYLQSFEVANLLDLQDRVMPAAGVDFPLVQLFGDMEDRFINENGGGFSVPYDIVFNFSSAGNADPSLYDDFPFEVDGTTTYRDFANAEAINFLGQRYAEGIGPWKNSIFLREPIATPVDGNLDGLAEITTQLTGEVRPLIEWAHNGGMQIHPYTLRDEERYLTLNPDGSPQSAMEEFEQYIAANIDGFFTDFTGTGVLVTGEVVANDADGDGLSDEFEIEFFGDVTSGIASEDSDNDGFSNLEEELFGTNPLDGNSTPTLDIRMEGSVAVVSLPTSTRFTYTFLGSTDMETFEPIFSGIRGTGEVMEFREETEGDSFKAFRVSVSE
ncbi:MAG: esterase-like activity of phytase family protein [Verrucomicrobiota bacterium JB023]|nr:esterase-like activity of phytase family protein [Verrucomicrobiota bacterium JB023]